MVHMMWECFLQQEIQDLPTFHTTGCFFFTGPPPKMFKYRKVNLGLQMLQVLFASVEILSQGSLFSSDRPIGGPSFGDRVHRYSRSWFYLWVYCPRGCHKQVPPLWKFPCSGMSPYFAIIKPPGAPGWGCTSEALANRCCYSFASQLLFVPASW